MELISLAHCVITLKVKDEQVARFRLRIHLLQFRKNETVADETPGAQLS